MAATSSSASNSKVAEEGAASSEIQTEGDEDGIIIAAEERRSGSSSEPRPMAQSPPTPSSENDDAVAARKLLASSPSSSSSSSSRSSSGLFVLCVQILISVAAGAMLGAYITASLLESEYQHIVSKLRSDRRSSLLQTKSDHIACQSRLSDERRSNDEEMAELRIDFDRAERSFQRKLTQYAAEANATYRAANEGLSKASLAANDEMQSHERTRGLLSQCNRRLESSVSRREEERRASARSLDAAERENRLMEAKVQGLEGELDGAFEELERRDAERAECDGHHREMLVCREALKEALVDLANSSNGNNNGGSSSDCRVDNDNNASSHSCNSNNNNDDEALKQMTTQLDQLKQQEEELQMQQTTLIEEGNLRRQLIDEITLEKQDVERERDGWEHKAKEMMEKINFRNRKEVLEEFGPGPHHVKLTFAFPSQPHHQSILLELAPLDLMPHTVHTVLSLVKNKLYDSSTFFLLRNHILVGGPINSHDPVANAELERRMASEGYLLPDNGAGDGGALLFAQYSPEYPHEKYTVGFNQAGGPVFYVNLEDNTRLHGPHDRRRRGNGGSIVVGREGDPCFARIVDGLEVVERIRGMPRGGGGGGDGGGSDDDLLEEVVYISDSEVVDAVE